MSWDSVGSFAWEAVGALGLLVMRRSIERPAMIFVFLFRSSCRLSCLVLLHEFVACRLPGRIVMCWAGEHS
jgi:hypothetical protein